MTMIIAFSLNYYLSMPILIPRHAILLKKDIFVREKLNFQLLNPTKC